MRISKDPDVRRGELIEAAELLFREKGYTETSVSDIVEKVGVAQGTFYYYFKSKDDMVNAVIDLYIDLYVARLERLLSDGQMSPVQKVQAIANDTLCMEPRHSKIVDFMHMEENGAMHQKYLRMSYERVIPLLVKIVEQGIAAGVFDVAHPEETVELLVYGIGYLGDEMARSPQLEKGLRRQRAAEALIERTLGLPKGTIRVNSEENQWPGFGAGAKGG